MNVRAATQAHCREIARVHLRAFPGFFLSSLGESVLTEFYRALIQTEECVVFIAVAEDERAIGFAAGCTTGGRLGRILLRRPRFLATILWTVVRRPELWFKVMKRRSRFQRPDNNPGASVLWSIGVATDRQRRGTGRQLLDAFEARCAAAGADEIVLTTDLKGNKRVLNFYETAGYESCAVVRESGRELAVMKKRFRAGAICRDHKPRL